MSQHHLTVKTIHGTTLKLMAGWDWPLRQFFLSLTDDRLVPGEAVPHQLRKAVNYDSIATMEGIRGFRSIGDVEHQLVKHGVPFTEEHEQQRLAYKPDAPQVFNPKLLSLLCEILTEQDSPRPDYDRKVKFWDNEPEPATPSVAELERQSVRIQEWQRQYEHRYQLEDPHPLYSGRNWKRWLEEQDDVMPYENWVRSQLVEEARLLLLANGPVGE